MHNNESIRSIVKQNLPQNGVATIFGYGSKVIRQSGKQTNSDLIDLIVVVDNTEAWHKENLERNFGHYSFVRYLPNRLQLIKKIQENVGARVYFNPYVSFAHLSFKYGVVKAEHLLDDLLKWDKLYLAGRLHKPVEFFVTPSDKYDRLKAALQLNRENALRAALLQLPESFDPKTLFKKITELSYRGDPRMLFGEDKNKIDKIVTGQYDLFEQIYSPMLGSSGLFSRTVHWNNTNKMFSQDLSSSTQLKYLKLLPLSVSMEIYRRHHNKARSLETDTVLESVSRSINCNTIVAQALISIVRKSSLSQSIKGLFTAGLIKSVKYSQKKLIKSVQSRITCT